MQDKLAKIRAKYQQYDEVYPLVCRDISWLLEQIDHWDSSFLAQGAVVKQLEQRVRELESQINRHRPKPLRCDRCKEVKPRMAGSHIYPELTRYYLQGEEILCSDCLPQLSTTTTGTQPLT